MKWFFICFLIVCVGCKRGEKQRIEVRNLSSQNVYFALSKNNNLSSNDIAFIRPINSVSVEQLNNENSDNKRYFYPYLIEKDSLTTIISSESAGIFVNKITIQSIINDRFDGKVNVFIVKEKDLSSFTDEEIVSKSLYKFFKTITADDMTQDVLILEYK